MSLSPGGKGAEPPLWCSDRSPSDFVQPRAIAQDPGGGVLNIYASCPVCRFVTTLTVRSALLRGPVARVASVRKLLTVGRPRVRRIQRPWGIIPIQWFRAA